MLEIRLQNLSSWKTNLVTIDDVRKKPEATATVLCIFLNRTQTKQIDFSVIRQYMTRSYLDVYCFRSFSFSAEIVSCDVDLFYASSFYMP